MAQVFQAATHTDSKIVVLALEPVHKSRGVQNAEENAILITKDTPVAIIVQIGQAPRRI